MTINVQQLAVVPDVDVSGSQVLHASAGAVVVDRAA
jgi:hypothetical protein